MVPNVTFPAALFHHTHRDDADYLQVSQVAHFLKGSSAALGVAKVAALFELMQVKAKDISLTVECVPSSSTLTLPSADLSSRCFLVLLQVRNVESSILRLPVFLADRQLALARADVDALVGQGVGARAGEGDRLPDAVRV